MTSRGRSGEQVLKSIKANLAKFRSIVDDIEQAKAEIDQRIIRSKPKTDQSQE